MIELENNLPSTSYEVYLDKMRLTTSFRNGRALIMPSPDLEPKLVRFFIPWVELPETPGRPTLYLRERPPFRPLYAGIYGVSHTPRAKMRHDCRYSGREMRIASYEVICG